MPFVRPFRWQFVLLTYLLPIIPILVFWDGLVSHLRSYTIQELEALAGTIDAPKYIWEARKLALGTGVRATALIGRAL